MTNKATAEHLIKGKKAEQQACRYLLNQGLKLIDKNYSCRHGELDLIMQQQDTLVVVEVRFRKSSQFGRPEETISKQKQSRIINTTQQYLIQHKLKSAVRFDVIAMSADNSINWIQNAFQN